jgi:pimeloyl-ACP methyl ester carboxylesterase
MMVPSAVGARQRYARLRLPVAIIAGDGDRMVSTEAQSGRLHWDIAQSEFRELPETGHMVHHTATGAVLAAIERVAGTSAATGQATGNDADLPAAVPA